MKPAPPMLSGPPIVGHALQFFRDRHALIRRGMAERGNVFGIRLFNQPAAVLVGADHQETFFTETDKKLSMHKTYRFLNAIFGDIAFAAPPEVYNEQRPVLHSPFKASKMAFYLRVMQEEVQAFLDALPDEGELELTGELNTVIQNVAAHALMGKRFRDSVGREFWDLYEVLARSLDPLLPPNLPLPKFIRRDRAKEKLRAMLRPIIEERRQNPGQYDDFLEEFLQARTKEGKLLPDETIIGMLLALMFAGHETTTGQATWALIQLLQHPEQLARVRAEIDAQLPRGAVFDAPQLMKLPTVIRAVAETSRMRPSADVLLRRVEQELEVGDYVIPPGWVLFVSSVEAHHLGEQFKEPAKYDPDRFGPDRAEDKAHRFGLIGFGGGVHKCVGMNFANNEMAVITALMLQQLELRLVTKSPHIVYGVGAARPSRTLVHYLKRKAVTARTPSA